MNKPPSIVLLGPTGSGKTPLGEFLQQNSLLERPCRHFDFGAHLRAAATAPSPVPNLGPAEQAIIRQALDKNQLLENDTFYIAETLLKTFIQAGNPADNPILILNGLPRHAGQAHALSKLIDVRCLIVLQCDAYTVRERIRLNSGGDRTSRTDDSESEINTKLLTFATRTAPLIQHYRDTHTPIIPITVHTLTQPADVASVIAQQGAKHALVR